MQSVLRITFDVNSKQNAKWEIGRYCYIVEHNPACAMMQNILYVSYEAYWSTSTAKTSPKAYSQAILKMSYGCDMTDRAIKLLVT